MPSTQTGQPYRLGPNRWGIRYYDRDGVRRRKSPFPSKPAALRYYRETIEPQIRGEAPPPAELTLSELVELYLERHAARVAIVRGRSSTAPAPAWPTRSTPTTPDATRPRATAEAVAR